MDGSAIERAIDRVAPDLIETARRIHANPEVRWQEHRAAEWLCALVERAGVAVEKGVGGMPTAFRARAGRGGGARIAILAEYDALPEIGHACGHNLIGTGAVGAFLALAAEDELAGEAILLGTPAEEGGGGKIKLIEAGAFEGVDAALMFHPLDRDVLAMGALASEWITFSFTGTPSHAAAAPWAGSSALTSVIQTFNLIDSQRVHFRDGTRVHGFITNGGQAVNIIPERAACQFSVRAPDHATLVELCERILDCAAAAARATRTRVEVTRQPGYRDLRNNMTLARAFGAHLSALGRKAPETDPTLGLGSTDMGDVSHVVPSIHPYLGICEKGESMCHEHTFAARAASDRAMQAMLVAAKALARTALELLRDPELLGRVRDEFSTGDRAARPPDPPLRTA